MKEEKTQEFKKIIGEGSAEQINEFMVKNFSSVNKTESLIAMTYRLKDEQWLRKQIAKKVYEVQLKLYDLRDLLMSQRELGKPEPTPIPSKGATAEDILGDD